MILSGVRLFFVISLAAAWSSHSRSMCIQGCLPWYIASIQSRCSFLSSRSSWRPVTNCAILYSIWLYHSFIRGITLRLQRCLSSLCHSSYHFLSCTRVTWTFQFLSSRLSRSTYALSRRIVCTRSAAVEAVLFARVTLTVTFRYFIVFLHVMLVPI